MSWLKNVIIDIAVTAFIVLTVVQDWRWAVVAVWIYTGLMLLIKAFGLFAGSLRKLAGESGAPDWFFHFLYGVNFGALLLDGRWILAVGWAVIWLLSLAAKRQPLRI